MVYYPPKEGESPIYLPAKPGFPKEFAMEQTKKMQKEMEQYKNTMRHAEGITDPAYKERWINRYYEKHPERAVFKELPPIGPVLNRTTPVKQYRNFDVPPGHSPTHQLPQPQNLVPQYSQLNVTPDYGITRTGGIGQLSDRGSVSQSGYPESNPAGLGVPPSLLPRPGTEQANPMNRVINIQKTTTMINPPLLPTSQSVIPVDPTLIGRFGKKPKNKKKAGKKPKTKKTGFYGI